MSIASDKKELMHHVGHKITVTYRGEKSNPDEALVYCVTCSADQDNLCVLYEEPDDFD